MDDTTGFDSDPNGIIKGCAHVCNYEAPLIETSCKREKLGSYFKTHLK